MKIGDSIKDVRLYLIFRIRRLILQRKDIPKLVEPELRATKIDKINNKIQELKKTLEVIEGDIKKASKKEYNLLVSEYKDEIKNGKWERFIRV